MTREQIDRALRDTEGRIIGLRKGARREFGGTEKSEKCAWPADVQSAMRDLKDQAKSYRAMLARLGEMETNR